MKLSLAGSFLVAMGFGCASTHQYAPPPPPPPPETATAEVYVPPEPMDEHGVTYSKFEDNLLSVWRGEYSDDVADTLGLPDSKKAGSYDGRTEKPWFGETWIYSFPTSKLTGRRCELTFQEDEVGYLRLSTWNWYDY